jgi:hypothetical protein
VEVGVSGVQVEGHMAVGGTWLDNKTWSSGQMEEGDW